MERKLPVLLARAVVASSTSKYDSANTTFKDRIRFAEPGVADVANKACDIDVTITIKVEKKQRPDDKPNTHLQTKKGQ